jgi:hypothetical protein
MKISISADMFHQVRRLGFAATAAFLCSCAGIMHGTHQDVGISSNPTGAKVFVDDQMTGATPVIAHLRRKDNHIVRIELAGYKPYETTITRTTSGWVWGNLVFGGLIGLAVDALDGGLYNLTPDQVSGTMLAGTAENVPTQDAVYVAVVLAPESGWEKVGQLQRD